MYQWIELISMLIFLQFRQLLSRYVEEKLFFYKNFGSLFQNIKENLSYLLDKSNPFAFHWLFVMFSL